MNEISLVSKFILRLFILLFSLLSFSCNNSNADSEVDFSIPSTSDKGSIPVRTAFAREEMFYNIITSNGKIISAREQQFVAEDNQVIGFTRISNGAIFHFGDFILVMDTTVLHLKLERALLNLYNTQKEYESQIVSYENLFSTRSDDQKAAILKKIRISSGLAGAEQDLKEIQLALSRATINAPFTGVAADVMIQQGQFIKPGQGLFKLYDNSNMFAEIKVMESDIRLLEKGVLASVSPITDSSQIYPAVVEEINPYVDVNGMITVKLRIKNENISGRSMFPGMNCNTIMKIPIRKSIKVPREAVVWRDNRPVVFTMENNMAFWNYVVIGGDNGVEMEIRKGIKAGQKVIISNTLQLGHRAHIIEQVKDSIGINGVL